MKRTRCDGRRPLNRGYNYDVIILHVGPACQYADAKLGAGQWGKLCCVSRRSVISVTVSRVSVSDMHSFSRDKGRADLSPRSAPFAYCHRGDSARKPRSVDVGVDDTVLSLIMNIPRIVSFGL